MTDSSNPIVVVGAGIGGLFSALCLHRLGLNSVVLEKNEELAEVGSGIQIGANGSRLIHKLGLQSELEKYATAPARGIMMDGISGQMICPYPLDSFAQVHHQYPHYQIRRADLQRVLVEALEHRDPDSLKLGVELAEIQQTPGCIEAITAQGQVFQGRALVGCDGIHSRTRELLFGKTKPSFSGCVAWRAMVPAASLDFTLAQRPMIWIGPGRHIVQYPVASGQLINIVACIDTSVTEQEQWQGNSSGTVLRESFSDWCPQVIRLISQAEDALRWGLYERPVLDSWTSGRATLLGDSAHAMLPSLAQGAVMAMEDADQLAISLAEQADTVAALEEYQSKRILRTRKTQAVARQNMEFFHQRRLLDRLSAKALHLVGDRAEDLIGNRYNWLYGYSGDSESGAH
jgi:salicylate hydroxylase